MFGLSSVVLFLCPLGAVSLSVMLCIALNSSVSII